MEIIEKNVSELDYLSIELELYINRNYQSEEGKKNKIGKNEDGLRDLQDNLKRINICIIGAQKEKKRKDRKKKRLKIITKPLKNVDKGYIFTDSRKSITPKEDKPTETHVYTNSNQTSKKQKQ